MAGPFDDLIPAQAAPQAGPFDDLVPQAAAPGPIQPSAANLAQVQATAAALGMSPARGITPGQYGALSPADQQLAQTFPDTMRNVAVQKEHEQLPFWSRVGQNITDAGRVALDTLTAHQADKIGGAASAFYAANPNYSPFADPAFADASTLAQNVPSPQAAQAATAQNQQATADADTRLGWMSEPARVAGALAPAGAITKAYGLGADALQGIPIAGRLAQALTLPASGATYGAVDAAGAGQPIGPAAAVGALGGTIGGLAGAATTKGINAAGEAAAARSALTPTYRPGLSLLSEAIGDADPQAIQAQLQRLGPDANLMDVDQNFQGYGQGLAIKNGPHKQLLFDALNNRGAETNTRVANDIARTVGVPAQTPEQFSTNLQAQHGALGQQLNPVLANAPPVDTTGTIQAADALSPNAAASAGKAINYARNQLYGQNLASPSGISPIADARTLQNVKDDLYGSINFGNRQLGSGADGIPQVNGALKTIAGALNGDLRDQVPGYSPIMDQMSALHGQQDAFNAGAKALQPGTTANPADFATAFGAMPQAQQDAMKLGISNALQKATGIRANDGAAVRSVLQGDNGWNAQNIGTAFGPQAQAGLENAAAREATFADTKNRVLNGAMTAFRNAAADKMADAERKPLFETGPNATIEGWLSPLLKPIFKIPNAAADYIRGPVDNSARDMAVAKAVSASGPERDALIASLQGYAGRAPNWAQQLAGPTGQILAHALIGASPLAAPLVRNAQ